ncbi:MAG: carboxypeptidase M32 [Lachnospiraceae bacterium]
MELNEALQRLEMLQKKMYAYNAAESSLYLDSVTTAPKDTAEGRGVAMGILAGESQKLITDPEVGHLLEFLSSHSDELTFPQKRQVEELTRDYNQMTRIPADEYMEYAMLTNEASDVWHKAKETDDFELFRPVLEKLVEFNIKFAGYYDSTKKPYDALLNEYERGTDMEYLDRFFDTIREKLVPLIHAIGQAPQIDDSFLHRHYPVEAQKKFSDYLMEVLGLDRNHCTIGETEHPFTLEFNNQDVRITTNYAEDNVTSSMYSVIHEGGHAKYELGIRDDLQYTRLAGGVSMGVHESQSRFYENLIGRSRPFIEAIFPKMQEFFPEQLQDITAEQMYRAVNRVQPSLIRTEADELTYCLHVMIRYEIEKQLIGGTLAVKDIPAVWNRLYEEYLGVKVPNDRQGCLQDSHWSGGSFGYFPSYALGSAYGAQMLKNMEQESDVWGPVSRGDLTGVSAWLKEKVHQYGSLLEPADVVKNACGEFDPTVYTDYLTAKYTELYHLNGSC